MKISDQTKSPESHDTISERAAEYFERRHFEQWTDANQAELDAWLSESTLHRVAYLRVKGAATYADRLATANSLKGPPKSSRRSSRSSEKFGYRRLMLPLLAAASIGALAMLALPLVSSFLQPPMRSLSTDVGGRTLLRFLDGTEFELNTNTAIRYQMTNRERTVWLEKGEVWFHVAHNAQNPFAVIVGRHRISDLGTEFLLRRDSNQIEVALLNGAATLGTEGVQTVTLRPGDDAIATAVSVSLIRKTPQEFADKLAWRSGVLVFRNARLADVIRELNRYNTTKLIITDPSIEGVRISTNLKADALEEFVRLTEDLLNLRADRKGNEILFSRRESDEMKRAAHFKRSQ
jgi:transmembrane sensor